MSPADNNNWGSWQHHVLEELKRLSAKIEQMDANIMINRVELGQFKIKSGVFGAIGASIPILIYCVMMMIEKQ
uniref:Uncharacterized protein n=1 Tax=viral metagenome TaxID=1070528 RepID=A0A6M3L9P8_9ZZZZ